MFLYISCANPQVSSNNLKTIATIFILLTFFVSIGQNIRIDTSKSIQEIEQTLMTLADTAFHRGWNIDFDDSLTPEDIFIEKLSLTLKSPKFFKYKFPLLAKQHSDYNAWRIFIIYSDDSLFRVFNWLSPSTGTMHHFPAIFQAKNKNGKVLFKDSEVPHIDGSMALTCYESIFRLESAARQIYLCIGSGQGSTSLPFQMIETYEVTSDSIEGANVLPDSTNLTSAILIDRQATFYGEKGQDIPEVEYDTKTQVLTLPEIVGSYAKEGDIKWNGKLIRLKFNGQKFERQK